MLQPEDRHLLLDSLRPPPGFSLDAAIGTTFTLDLIAMLLPPVAFARYEIEGADGEALVNPIARLDAIRRHAGSITVFCQAGQTKPPSRDVPALAFLEESVIPVMASRPGGIFHPKIWLLRYTTENGARSYRFLCLSRNLTFDRSWDSILRLDGFVSDEPQPVNRELATFVRALPGLAVNALPASRNEACRSLAEDLEHVAWEGLPDGLSLERFWPLGISRRRIWPFPADLWRLLIISPFASPDAIARLTSSRSDDVLVTLPETIDQLGKEALVSIGQTYVLDADAIAEAGAKGEIEGPPRESALETELRGLHAKLYVADVPYRSRIWTGSANATEQAFDRNVEFMVELRGRKDRHGVAAMLEADRPQELGFGRLLQEYTPPDVPVEPDPREEVQRSLDRFATEVGRLRFTAEVREQAENRFQVELTGEGDRAIALPDDIELRCRPAPLELADTKPDVVGARLTARFSSSLEALSAFFVFTISTGEGRARQSKEFAVPARLVGAPEDRLDQVIHAALNSRSDLMRLLFLLLGMVDPGGGDLERIDIAQADRMNGSDGLTGILGTNALLEPLIRAAARTPRRIVEIEKLVAQVAGADEKRPAEERLVPPELPPLLAVLREATGGHHE